ncbi:T9SS type A sorting domain-containing protein [Brumimicrobium aurantiacum]|uniref:T9SS C-terminal target domain-containing protein n=1 Tax=Brumimicrobium aurantiacum TaxID=1737063 RepID=A0A3E1EWK3_9FLAO|nr:T9SS type A sorting domain-containing protein [Brumimicrobium aurantiacum]RFC53935.1 T9SS C-terminal target domain-containing protein [Brumimicrobium aurantiacum]
MKVQLIFLLILITPVVFGQITIDQNDILQSGDSVGVSVASDLNINYSTTGQNMNWDFSGLTESDQYFEKAQSISSGGIIINVQFGPFAPSEYRASYFQSFDGLPIDDLTSFLPVQISSVNRMIKVESNQFTIPGYSLDVDGQIVGFKSDSIEKAYSFPLNFGDSYSSSGYTDINFAPIYDARVIMNRQRQSEVDGFGQLTTPFETYEVIRVKHSIYEMDSLYIEFGPIQQWIPIERTTNEYEWWAKDKKRPVLKVETETVFGNESPTRITYLNNETTHLVQYQFNSELYPNPTTGEVSITTKEDLQRIVVYSTDGREVYHKEVSGTTASLNLAHLSPGMYRIQLISSKGQSFNPIVIK